MSIPSPAGFTREEHPAGVTLFQEGAQGDAAYLIESGCVEIVREVEGQSRRLDMLAAEGIEEQPVGSRLAAMGCTYAQGHHYARPLTKADFLDWSGAPAPA